MDYDNLDYGLIADFLANSFEHLSQNDSLSFLQKDCGLTDSASAFLLEKWTQTSPTDRLKISLHENNLKKFIERTLRTLY